MKLAVPNADAVTKLFINADAHKNHVPRFGAHLLYLTVSFVVQMRSFDIRLCQDTANKVIDKILLNLSFFICRLNHGMSSAN